MSPADEMCNNPRSEYIQGGGPQGAGVLRLLARYILFCIVLYCIVLYCIVLYCIVLYCIVLYCKQRESTFEESFHVGRARQPERRAAGVGGDGRVGPARQQQTHDLQVVVVDGVVYRSEATIAAV